MKASTWKSIDIFAFISTIIPSMLKQHTVSNRTYCFQSPSLCVRGFFHSKRTIDVEVLTATMLFVFSTNRNDDEPGRECGDTSDVRRLAYREHKRCVSRQSNGSICEDAGIWPHGKSRWRNWCAKGAITTRSPESFTSLITRSASIWATCATRSACGAEPPWSSNSPIRSKEPECFKLEIIINRTPIYRKEAIGFVFRHLQL